MITFRPNDRKILEAITWVANTVEHCPAQTILQILFYADKFHLQKYGRPVTGDIYKKTAYGPAASTAYDFLHEENDAQAFSICNNCVLPKRAALEDWLSGTDVACLKESVDAYGTMNIFQETAYVHSDMGHVIDYALFIDNNMPDRNEFLKYIEESSLCQVM